MKSPTLEKGFILAMFAIILVIFSFAQKDTEKLSQMYTSSSSIKEKNTANLNTMQDKNETTASINRN